MLGYGVAAGVIREVQVLQEVVEGAGDVLDQLLIVGPFAADRGGDPAGGFG